MTGRSNNWRIRWYALQKVSKSDHPKCVYCGCDFPRALEINHKNPTAKKQEKISGKPVSGYSFYKRIVNGERSVEDLEVTCGVCNKNHYFQRKFGLKWQIIYEDQSSKGRSEN